MIFAMMMVKRANGNFNPKWRKGTWAIAAIEGLLSFAGPLPARPQCKRVVESTSDSTRNIRKTLHSGSTLISGRKRTLYAA
jgi:hypothetical protein